MAVCQTREELEAERKRVDEMRKGTGVVAGACWRFQGGKWNSSGHPAFANPPRHYEAAIGIVEGKPVFEGDVLYDAAGRACTAPWASRGIKMGFPKGNHWSWNRPTKNLVTVDLETRSDMADAISYLLHDHHKCRPTHPLEESKSPFEEYLKETSQQIGNAHAIPVDYFKGDAMSLTEATKLYGPTQPKETTMTKFFEEKKFAYLEGRDITHLGNDEILGAISRAEKRLDKLSELKNKPKMVKDEMDTLTLDLQNLITYLDERQAEKDSDE